MDDLVKGTLEWGQDHQIANCNAVNHSAQCCNNMYLLEKRECTKTAGPGVTRQVRISTQDRNEAAKCWAVPNSSAGKEEILLANKKFIIRSS